MQGEAAKGLVDLDRAIELGTPGLTARLYRGLARRTLGDAQGAIADLGKYVQLAPANDPRAAQARDAIEAIRAGR